MRKVLLPLMLAALLVSGCTQMTAAGFEKPQAGAQAVQGMTVPPVIVGAIVSLGPRSESRTNGTVEVSSVSETAASLDAADEAVAVVPLTETPRAVLTSSIAPTASDRSERSPVETRSSTSQAVEPLRASVGHQLEAVDPPSRLVSAHYQQRLAESGRGSPRPSPSASSPSASSPSAHEREDASSHSSPGFFSRVIAFFGGIFSPVKEVSGQEAPQSRHAGYQSAALVEAHYETRLKESAWAANGRTSTSY